MSSLNPLSAILSGPLALTSLATATPPVAATLSTPAVGGFGDMLFRGVQQVEKKLDTADDMVRRLALGEELPIHQVSYALEQARLSVELAMQVRSRLLEGYHEIMNLQL